MNVFLAFHQTYEPVLGSIFLSAIVAGLPLYVLFVMLAVLRLPAWMCAVASMLTAALLGWIVWGMPLGITLGAATEGMAFGLWPISWIVLNAVFFHNLTVASGDFDVIKRALARLTVDRRLQALLVAFSFGALIEGIAGFGAPVAISASILASLGFEPVTAAVLALLANTAPVAFGSIGIPVVTLGRLVAPILGHPTDPTSTTLALPAQLGIRRDRPTGPHRPGLFHVHRPGPGDPRRADGQPAVVVRSPGQRPGDRPSLTCQHHRRLQMRLARLRPLPAAVGGTAADQGQAGLQVPLLELLLAGHVRREREGAAGFERASGKTDRGQGDRLQQPVQLGLPRGRRVARAVRRAHRLPAHASLGREGELLRRLWTHSPPARPAHPDDLDDSRDRLHHELRGHDIEPRPRAFEDGLHLPVRRRVPGLARRLFDRQ